MKYREAKLLFEKEYFSSLWDSCEGKMYLAARESGLERTTLYDKLHKLNIRPKIPGFGRLSGYPENSETVKQGDSKDECI